MKSILDYIKELPQDEWDYYYDISMDNKLQNPFFENNSHIDFIKSYFTRGGKVEVINSIDIEIKKLRYPNHINSVFFIGLLFYYKTNLNKKYNMGLNGPGYRTFPFIWFLIALFHDYAYEVETNFKEYEDIETISGLNERFLIDNLLLNKVTNKKANDFLATRNDYFKYRRDECKVIDHGLLAGMLLFDRLIKIRRLKFERNEDNLFWGKELEKQYALAAEAITLHNIWIPSKAKQDIYKKHNLNYLIDFKPIRYKTFELFYLLGVIDTIDPIKTFSKDGFGDNEILDSLLIEFGKNSITIQNGVESKLDFGELIKRTSLFHGWLDVKISFSLNKLKIAFN